MKVNCQNEKCGYVINIPDNKIPKRPVRIACPKCKTPNIIKPPVSAQSPAASASPQAALESKIMAEVERRLAAFRREGMQPAGTGQMLASADSFSPLNDTETKKALICDDDQIIRQVIKDSVEKLGYLVDEASTIEQSLGFLKQADVDYDLILIDKVFPDDAEGGYKILSKVATLPLDIRRQIFVAFISGDMKSGDPTSAFLMGANMVVNKKDLKRLPAILKEELAEYKRLYRVFSKCLHLAKTYSH